MTYQGHPLYYYAADASTPDNMKGADIDQFGADWFLVGANGQPVEHESESDSDSGSGTSGGPAVGSSGG